MLVYPQLSTGAQGQFPITKRRVLRTVLNRASDSRAVKLPDSVGGRTEWTLEYAGLNDAEAQSLRDFFDLTEGTLETFTFLDPTANLLAWSDHLDDDVWTAAPLLALTPEIADPRGGTKGWRLSNPAGGAQSITQTLQVPGTFTYCVSLYARSETPVTANLLLDTGRMPCRIAGGWGRAVFSGTGTADAEAVLFGFEVPAGATIDVFGMQVEAQPGASPYHPSIVGGVYPDARFRDDVLAMTAVSLGQHACTVNIIHADHL
jgi:hypothetical protein